jgi:hypothetical protein
MVDFSPDTISVGGCVYLCMILGGHNFTDFENWCTPILMEDFHRSIEFFYCK